jgi:hypothetical protein
MRHDERDPVPRGNILVAGGGSAGPEAARPSVNAASNARGDRFPDADDRPAPARGSASTKDEAGEPSPADEAATARSSPPAPGPVTPTEPLATSTDTSDNVAAAAPPPTPAEPPASGESTAAEARRPAPSGPPAHPDGSAAGAEPALPGVPSTGRPATESRRWVAVTPAREPSWAKVLITTISLWVSRRLRRLIGHGRPGRQAVGAPGAPGWRRTLIRWPLVVFVLALIILALTGLQLSAMSHPSKGKTATGSSGQTGSSGALSAAEATRGDAATWVAQQVTASDLIACDPLTCSTLEGDGVAASRLMSIRPTATDPLGADVVVATSSIRSQFGSQLVSEYAPELIASFGTGANRVDVRTVANFGAAAFKAAEQKDLKARKDAGAQLLRNGFHVGEQGAGQIQSGQVDSRLLVTLAALLSQRTVDVSSFGDTGPGAPVLYRQVTIVDAPGQTGIAALTADLKQAQAQSKPYLPANAELVHLANGQSALRIEFGAPDQPGLLSGGNS